MKKLIPLFLVCLLLSGCAAAPASPAETTLQEASLTLFLPDEQAEKLEAKDVQVSEISYQVILEQLTSAGVLTEDVMIQAFAVESSEMAMDFNTAFAALVGSMGTAGETMILSSVVNTFLTAYQADTVKITVNGSPLETGHNIYDTPLAFFE